MMDVNETFSKKRPVQVQSAKFKYWLLDFIVIFIIAATLTIAYGATAPIAPECDEDNTGIDNTTTRALRSNLPITSPTANQPQEIQENPQSPPKVYRAGDFVEVLEPTIHPTLAFSAQIHHVFNRPDGTVKYIVRPGFGRPIDHRKFDSSTIRAFGTFEEDDHAMCDLGQALNAELTPCTILEHINSNHYGVSFTTREGELTQRLLPVSRIRRIVLDPAGNR